MQNDKMCAKCGQPAAAKLNDSLYVCASCAEKATLEYLNQGQMVMWKHRGTPEYLLVPASLNHSQN